MSNRPLIAALVSLTLVAACGPAEGPADSDAEPTGDAAPRSATTPPVGPEVQPAPPMVQLEPPARIPDQVPQQSPFYETEVDARDPLPSTVGPIEAARVAALGPPDAPTNVYAAPLDGCARVVFTVPTNAPVLAIMLYASSGSIAVASASDGEGKICGLGNHVQHTITATAVGPGGESAPSLPSNRVMPLPAP
jgi:hypothetical protein